jgi:hypothetical protein
MKLRAVGVRNARIALASVTSESEEEEEEEGDGKRSGRCGWTREKLREERSETRKASSEEGVKMDVGAGGGREERELCRVGGGGERSCAQSGR